MNSIDKAGAGIAVPGSLIAQLQGLSKQAEVTLGVAPQAPGPSPRPTPTPAPVAP